MIRKIDEARDGRMESFEDIKRLPVVIISEGLGNLADRNFYTKEAIVSGPAIYEGKKSYMDHPTETEQEEQPGRSVRATAGHFEDVKAVPGKDGRMELRAMFVPEEQPKILAKIQHAVEFKKKYPDKDYIAFSINGDGEGFEMPYDDFIDKIKPSSVHMPKLKQIEGQNIYVITKFTDAVSADLVTEAGARGRFLSEQAKKQKRRNQLMKVSEAIRNFFDAISKGDRKALEAAEADIKSQLEDETEKAKEAAEAEKSETEALVKAMLAAKKEMKKKEDESDEAYQSRCMKQAMKNMKQKKEAKKEDESEDEAEKKEKKKEAKSEDEKAEKDKEKKEAKKEDESEDESEDEGKKKKEKKKEAKKEDEDDGDDDDDKKKLKKENAELRAQLNKLQETEVEAVKTKTLQERREFLEEMDDMLAESGLSRKVTKEMKPLLLKCKSVAEMKSVVKKFTEAHEELIQEEFFVHSRGNFPAKEATETTESTDDCFI